LTITDFLHGLLQGDEDEDGTQKIPFSSFVSPKTEDQDPDKDEVGAELEFSSRD
jgi:hypothetical protein